MLRWFLALLFLFLSILYCCSSHAINRSQYVIISSYSPVELSECFYAISKELGNFDRVDLFFLDENKKFRVENLSCRVRDIETSLLTLNLTDTTKYILIGDLALKYFSYLDGFSISSDNESTIVIDTRYIDLMTEPFEDIIDDIIFLVPDGVKVYIDDSSPVNIEVIDSFLSLNSFLRKYNEDNIFLVVLLSYLRKDLTSVFDKASLISYIQRFNSNIIVSTFDFVPFEGVCVGAYIDFSSACSLLARKAIDNDKSPIIVKPILYINPNKCINPNFVYKSSNFSNFERLE